MATEIVRSAASAGQVIDPKSTAAKADAAKPARDFTAVMKRIEAHAESVETLKNGAKLYHLPGGREIEQVPGKSPYVTKKGTWPPPAAAPAATTPATTAPAATTTPSTTTTPPTTTTPSTTATPSTTTTPGTTKAPGTTTPAK